MAKRIYTLKKPPQRVAYNIKYEELLNEQQQKVVFHDSGPMLVLAGAGTGKTRTLTYRVARLLESGVHPENMLLLTFTNKAAREMMGRVGNLMGKYPDGLWGGTFHHVGSRILRKHSQEIGFPERFSIMDTEDARILMNLCVADARVSTTKKRFPRANLLCQLYSFAINTGRSVTDVIVERAPHFAEQLHDIEKVFALYIAKKRELGVMDFDDLLLNWKVLFEKEEDIFEMYATRFEYVLVDEYQDTNRIQGELIDRCAALHHNLMVVGDDCQSIYQFRGAEFTNILEFPNRHVNTSIFKLETNYRSTKQILDISNASIRFNRRQFHKNLQSVQPDDMPPAVVACRTVDQQATFIAQRALEIRDEGVDLNEIAILYRAHYQSMEIQVELTRRGIPFIVRSGVRFFEQAHIKDVLSFLRLAYNPRDELAFQRIMGIADGIGKRFSQKIWSQINQYDDCSEGWEQDGIADSLPKRQAKSWDRMRRLLIQLKNGDARNPAELIDLVQDKVYASYLRKSYENFETRAIDIEQVGNFAAQHDNLEHFLQEISLQSGIQAEDIHQVGEQDEYLVLSTIHQAKGLEFRAVFLVWLAEGRFPSARSETEDGIEEERRLFYVAVTRAKNELYLTYPITVRERERGLTLVRRSPFIEELNPDLYEEWVLNPD